MSTNGCIARTGKSWGEFEGVYHHWDSNPTTLGKTLWDLYHGYFAFDLPKMLAFLIDKHTAWSTINDRDFNKKPGYRNERTNAEKNGPECYCHGARREENERVNRRTAKDYSFQWIYIFNAETRIMIVRDARHDVQIEVDLNGDEPNWDFIECGENWERCSHYAWRHKLCPKSCNLSTQEWLGRRTMDWHSAIAVILRDGKRYQTTGCGRGDGRTWTATLKKRNGVRFEHPVAVIDSNGDYSPWPGVTWIFPRNAVNPEETTLVGASV